MARSSPPNGGTKDSTHATRYFQLLRLEDVSGLSGVGLVAEGIQFHDGQCIVSWFGKYHSIETHPSIEQVEVLHGHGGRTKIIYPALLPLEEK